MTIQPLGLQPQAASMIHVTEPIITAMIQKAPDRMRSMTAPETIDAAVQENSRKAAQKTPVMRSERSVAIVGDVGRFAAAPSSSRPPVMNGPLGKAQ